MINVVNMCLVLLEYIASLMDKVINKNLDVFLKSLPATLSIKFQ
jgi:hypothetical protein